MHKIDSVLLEKILSRLSPSSLAAAEVTCRQWADLIAQRQLWQRHATCSCGRFSIVNRTPQPGTATATAAAGVDWRDICLHRTAASKWRVGKLLLSATLQGHTAAVTCIAALHNIVATGSSDATVRIWDLSHGKQLHVLRHGDAAQVVAVALPSMSLCVAATANAAFLWREGKVVRRFDVLPGGRITCLALTDTCLLLGSTAAAVQYFDLFSGSQQLMTRHSSSVTCLLSRQQDLQQLSALLLQDTQHRDDWQVIVGTYDGQVSCLAVSTGQILWQLPNRYPSRIVAVPVQQYKQYSDHGDVQPMPTRQLHQLEQQCEHQQGARVTQLLYLLNARSQLICWQVPGSNNAGSSSSSSIVQVQLPACDHCVTELLNFTTDTARNTAATQTKAAAAAGVAATATAAAAATDVNGPDNKRRHSGHHFALASMNRSNRGSLSSAGQAVAVCELPVAAPRSLLHSLPTSPLSGCTAMACPAYGNNCVFLGSSDGSLLVAQLTHTEIAAQDMSATHRSSSSSSSNSADVRGFTALPEAPQQQQQQQQQHQAESQVQQPAVRDAARSEDSNSSSKSSAYDLQLQLVRQYSLHPLAKAMHSSGRGVSSARPCGNSATGLGGTAEQRTNSGGSTAGRCNAITSAALGFDTSRGGSTVQVGRSDRKNGSSAARSDWNVVDGTAGKRNTESAACCARDQQQLPGAAAAAAAAASQVTCAVFLEGGKFAVGLASGHVCILRFALKSQQ